MIMYSCEVVVKNEVSRLILLSKHQFKKQLYCINISLSLFLTRDSIYTRPSSTSHHIAEYITDRESSPWFPRLKEVNYTLLKVF